MNCFIIMYNKDEKKYWLASRYFANGNWIHQQIGNSSYYKKIIVKLKEHYEYLNHAHEHGLEIFCNNNQNSTKIIHFDIKKNTITTNYSRKDNLLKYDCEDNFYFDNNGIKFIIFGEFLEKLGFNTKIIIRNGIKELYK